MGLFDYVRSSYDLGEQFTNVELQTKDLACAMCSYWICPNGCLYELTYRETHTFEIIEEDDERYDHKKLFLNFEWKPTGKRGRVEPYRVTDYIEVYPALWEGDWYKWPRCRIHLIDGKIQDFVVTIRSK